MIETVSENNLLEFEHFLQDHSFGSYLQCSAWSRQNPDWHWTGLIRRNSHGRITGVCSALVRSVKLLPYQMIYIGHGPVCSPDDGDTQRELLEGIRRMAKNEGACLVRLSPAFTKESKSMLSLLGSYKYHLRDAAKHPPMQPTRTWRIDTDGKDWDTLQAGFSPDVLQSVQTAMRHGIDIRHGRKALVPVLTNLLDRIALREEVMHHREEYYTGLLQHFGSQAGIYIAYNQNKPVAGAFILRYGDRFHCLAEADLSSPTLRVRELLTAAILQNVCEAGGISLEYPIIDAHNDFLPRFGGSEIERIGEMDWLRHPLAGALCRLFMKISNSIEEQRYFLDIK